MEQVAAKSALSVAEQSILGALLIIAVIALAALIIYVLKEKKNVEKSATDGMREVLANIEAFLSAQAGRDQIFIETITHERGRSKECYEGVVATLSTNQSQTLAAIAAVSAKLDVCQAKNCSKG